MGTCQKCGRAEVDVWVKYNVKLCASCCAEACEIERHALHSWLERSQSPIPPSATSVLLSKVDDPLTKVLIKTAVGQEEGQPHQAYAALESLREKGLIEKVIVSPDNKYAPNTESVTMINEEEIKSLIQGHETEIEKLRENERGGWKVLPMLYMYHEASIEAFNRVLGNSPSNDLASFAGESVSQEKPEGRCECGPEQVKRKVPEEEGFETSDTHYCVNCGKGV